MCRCSLFKTWITASSPQVYSDHIALSCMLPPLMNRNSLKEIIWKSGKKKGYDACVCVRVVVHSALPVSYLAPALSSSIVPSLYLLAKNELPPCLAAGASHPDPLALSTSVIGANYSHYTQVFFFVFLSCSWLSPSIQTTPAPRLYLSSVWATRRTRLTHFSLNICGVVISWTSLSLFFPLFPPFKRMLLIFPKDAHLHVNINQRYFSGGLQCFVRKLENDKQVCKATKTTPS